MSSEKELKQASIKEWFDETYRTRGSWYLRPVRAYYIFPELLKVQPGQKLLDVACGLGRLLEAGLEYKLELHGIDISEVAVEKAQQRLPGLNIREANAEQIPYANESFDFVTCLGSLERMIDLPKVLKEMHRVAKPGASFCFLARNKNGWTWKLFKQGLGLVNKKGSQGAKSLQEWTRLFEDCGFEIIQLVPDQYPIKKWQKIRSLGLQSVDYRSVSKSWIPLDYVHEFIFILRKRSLSSK